MTNDPYKLRTLADAIEAHEGKMRELFCRGREGRPVTETDRIELRRLQKEREAAQRACR